VESVKIGDRSYSISVSLSGNRNAWVRLKGDIIALSLPSRWPVSERKRIGDELLSKAIRSIELGRWKPVERGKIEFSHGQRVSALGKSFEIVFISGKRFGARIQDDRIEVRVVETHQSKTKVASALARKRMIEALMPGLLERIGSINDAHFKAEIKKVSVRDNATRWGSCSRGGSISLNFRLLFMPERILDYVIVHELAHTIYRGHGPRFWSLVENVIPDHLERRRWLRENGWSVPENPGGQTTAGQQILEGFYEEPY
jgi:predicted metal-dependent hydrolase